MPDESADPTPLESLEAKPHPTCPLCGNVNDCAAARTGRLDVACWCAAVVVDPAALARARDAQATDSCLCRRCATGEHAGPPLETSATVTRIPIERRN